jgi:predicted nuclease of predicted toxin-antitoxin system
MHQLTESQRGLSDEEVIQKARDEDRVVVTQDLDFGRLYYFHHRGQVGVIVMRLSRLTFAGMEARLREFLAKAAAESKPIDRALVVLEPHRHRKLR